MSDPARSVARPSARALSVSELTRIIHGELKALGSLAVEGEVSRVARATSGHLYFDLKDEGSKVACKLWKGKIKDALRFDLQEGSKVVAHGELDVYPPQGSYSLIVARLEPAGLGELLARLERLKHELRERGWFDRKRSIPAFPRRIGVVTSREGAAFQDILSIRSSRWSGFPMLLAHTAVQGPGAAQQIAQALARMDQAEVDVILLARGGGSLEDLWAFNELPVAEAIWNCRTPVVCGVGHESDLTLADLVCDLRAATPTDAARRTIPEREWLVRELERAWSHLSTAIDQRFERASERLERARRLAATAPLERRQAELAALGERLARRSSARALEQRGGRLLRAGTVLAHRLSARAREALERLNLSQARLEAFSHRRVLERGYSITRGPDGAILRSASGLLPGAALETEFAQGWARSRVEDSAAPDGV
jgi:exodeoxyribonuclease VII large subunit